MRWVQSLIPYLVSGTSMCLCCNFCQFNKFGCISKQLIVWLNFVFLSCQLNLSVLSTERCGCHSLTSLHDLYWLDSVQADKSIKFGTSLCLLLGGHGAHLWLISEQAKQLLVEQLCCKFSCLACVFAHGKGLVTFPNSWDVPAESLDTCLTDRIFI